MPALPLGLALGGGCLAAMAGCILEPAGEPSTAAHSAAIVGGTTDLQHTAVFDILVEGEQSCTGTLVSPHVVLTAAHCIVEDVDEATELVVFTGPDESDLAGGQLHEVVSGPIHPTYGTDPDDEEIGDMAVLVLAEPSTIQPMRYNRQALDPSMIGAPTTAVGYGDTTIQDPTSGGGTRRQVTLPLLDFDEDWVLVGGNGQSQCYGDSGGPVLMEINGIEQVIGINSWGETDDCGDVEYNTRVDLLASFVDQHVQANDPGFDPDAGDGSGGDSGDGSGGDSGDGSGGEGGGGGDDSGGGDGGGGGGSGGGSGGGGGGGDDGSGGGDTSVHGQMGCQMSTAPLGGPGALVLALALALIGRRRPAATCASQVSRRGAPSR